MKTRVLVGVSALSLAAIGSTAVATSAHAAIPNCGGNGAAPMPVPYTCNVPGIDITAQGVTRHVAAQVVANGQNVAVTFLMTGGLLPVDVPVLVVHHVGLTGGNDSGSGVIVAGTKTVTVVDSSPCREGQLDLFAWLVGPNYRVGGPYIQNGTGCVVETTTSAPPTTVATTVATTIAPTSSTNPFPGGSTSAPGTTGVASTSPVVPTSAKSQVKGAMPPTGGDTHAVNVALVLLLGGLFALFVVWFTRIRVES